MTSTHLVLIGLGVLLVAGLVIYNILQERRFRRQADRMFTQKREDPRLEEGLSGVAPLSAADEPPLRLDDAAPLDTGPAYPATYPEHYPGNLVHSLEPISPGFRDEAPEMPEVTERPSPEGGEALPPPAPPSPLDPEVEYVARLRFTHPLRMSLAGLLSEVRAIGKPVRAFGLRQDGAWEALGGQTGGYVAVELALQLADRGGPVSEGQLEGFCHALYEFAAENGGAVSCPERKTALERARALDQFCVDVDVLIGLNIVGLAGQSFSGDRIRVAAGELGLILGRDGVYVLQEDGRTLFSLASQEGSPFPAGGGDFATRGVSLLFDVPRVADGLAVFDRMTEVGMRLAERLGGRLVDDNGRDVGGDSLRKDRQRLATYFERMAAEGIPAGGERALRLFA